MLPYDSNYWEVLAKVGVEGNAGPAKVGLTLRGGSLFSGDNELSGSDQSSVLPNASYGTTGGVDGWKIGTDFWVRYPYSEAVTLPFLFRLDYSDKSRNGAGNMGDFVGFIDPPFFPVVLGPISLGPSVLDYNSNERSFTIEAGGGVDVLLSKVTRVAAGLYYNYLNVKNDMLVTVDDPATGIFVFNYGAMPDRTEHLVRFKLAGETQVCPEWTVRGGLDVFGGVAREDLGSDTSFPSGQFSASGSLDGTHWGITGFLGATTKLQGATVEPFIQAGYQELTISDHSGQSIVLGSGFLSDLDKDKKQAVVGAGVSILF
jgi:hypothetical protein